MKNPRGVEIKDGAGNVLGEILGEEFLPGLVLHKQKRGLTSHGDGWYLTHVRSGHCLLKKVIKKEVLGLREKLATVDWTEAMDSSTPRELQEYIMEIKNGPVGL